MSARNTPLFWRLCRPFISGASKTTSHALRTASNNTRRRFIWIGSSFVGCTLMAFGLQNSQKALAEDKTNTTNTPNTSNTPNTWKEWKSTVMTNYESRIRNFSSPEKIFSVFASVSKDGHNYMTMDDFIRALIPHEHGEMAAKRTDGTKKKVNRTSMPAAFKIADQNNDGLISFEEYLFFVTLLSIPEQSFKVAFKMLDVNEDGQVDQSEFMRLISFLRVASPPTQQTRSTSSGVAQGWLNHYFGDSSAKPLTFATFSKFLQQLKSDVLRLEFNIYDTQEVGYVSQRDFGMLLVSYANSKDLQSFMQRASTLETTPIKIYNFEQFQSFNILLEHLDEVQTAMHLYHLNGRPFKKKDLSQLSKIVCGTNLNQQVIDTIMNIFDTNNDGTLDLDEFVTVLARRKVRGLSEPRDTGFMRKVESILTCIKEA